MNLYLGIDIGGTYIKYGIVSDQYEIQYHSKVLTNAHLGGANIIHLVKDIISKVINSYPLIQGIGISTAGQVNNIDGSIIHASKLIPDYTGTNWKNILQPLYNLPIIVENDCNCAALAEVVLNNYPNDESIFALTLGTGVGGCLITNQKIYHGSSFQAGEIGYIKINNMRLDDLASTRGLIENVSKIKNNQVKLSGEEIFKLANEGDLDCINAINQMMYYVALTICNIAYISNPSTIIIGGGISKQSSYLFPILDNYLKQELEKPFYDSTKIIFSKANNSSGVIGSIINFIIKEK